MPELPEVETVVRGLARAAAGQRIISVVQRRADLRVPMPPELATRLTGRRILSVGRRAKYALATLDDGWTLILHLGMSGRLLIRAAGTVPPPAGPHDHLELGLEDGTRLVLCDPRRFGRVDLAGPEPLDAHPLFRHLGPEPLSDAFDGRYLADALAGRRVALKLALMDQRLVVGVGNIYASEALFRARLSPRRAAGTVGGTRAARLVAAVKAVLEAAIAAGGSSLRDYVQATGELGYFQHDWAVYGRAGRPCPGCRCDVAVTGGVRQIVQGARSTFYCPRLQR